MLIRGRNLTPFCLALLGVCLLVPAGASAIDIHAHRGGPNVDGKAAFGENSMAAFRHSLAAGYVIELDVARTADGVAVVMHDDRLNRTTNCEGDVDEHTWAELAPCRIDRIGIGDVREDLAPGDPRLEPIPSLGQVIDLLKQTGARANIEVKNLGATEYSFPRAVYSQLAASGLPSSQVIAQNFGPRSLEEAPVLYPGVELSQLSVNVTNDLLAIELATKGNAAWVSPEWSISADFMVRAREAGLKVVPWTIDDSESMLDASALGVDAVITNDPTLADRLIGPKPSLSLGAGPVTNRTRPGRLARFKVVIRNSGDRASAPGRLMAKSQKSAVIALGPKERQVPGIAPGASITRKFSFRVRARARPGKSSRVTFRLTDDEVSPLTVTRSIRVVRAPVPR